MFSTLLFMACKARVKVIKSPPHYDFSKVGTYKLDNRLKEISGLAWDTERNEFLTHIDERGVLYVLDRESKMIKAEYRFAGHGDFEDIAVYKGVPYVLRSDGMITKIIRDSAGVRGTEAGKLNITDKVDFETMYADTARKALIIICKNCDMDNKKIVSAFAFYVDSTGFDSKPIYQIDAAAVEEKAPKKTSKLQPSAAAIHPVLKKLFIISSAASILVIADLDGKVESVHQLGEKLFPQPEGLTFKSNGDMYISNEGVTSQGTILQFTYKP
jgi:uncharacterized protein YjiK